MPTTTPEPCPPRTHLGRPRGPHALTALGRPRGALPLAAPGRPRGRGPAAALALAAVLGLLLALPAAPAQAQPVSVGHVDSATYPIRVHYPTLARATVAATVLAEAERTWAVEVEQMGFAPPMTEDASGNPQEGLWIYLVEGADSAHAEAISGLDDTPYTDCTTRVLLPADLPAAYLPSYVAHESHHAMEMAVDCTEAAFAYENTTVAVTVLQFPEDSLWRGYFLPTFQAYPHHGVDCTFFTDANRRYYHYGAALFELFLDEWLGAGDGQLLPRFWLAARTLGTVTVGGGMPMASAANEPDLLDGIAAVLHEEGTSLDEAFAEFAQWRWFVGLHDDGAHFQHGDLWEGSEVTVAERHAVAQLPLEGATTDDLPGELGTVYLELDLAGVTPPMGVIFSFAGSAAARWHVDALRIATDGTVTVDPVELSATGQGESGHGSLAGTERLVFAVSALAGEEHDADRPACSTRHELTYGLRLADLDTAPVIEAVTPDAVSPGRAALLVVTGQGFLPGLTAEVEGDGVHVFSVQRPDEHTVHVTVTVDATTTPGPRDLVLTNPSGRSGRAPEAFAVVDAPAPNDGGCGCRTGGPTGAGRGAPLFLLFTGLIGLALRRRPGRGPARGRPR